jgi:metal-responsive CopG/Arc/MetJ family transcriptional regulator
MVEELEETEKIMKRSQIVHDAIAMQIEREKERIEKER